MDVRSSMIADHMDVVASDGTRVGKVDFVRDGCLVLSAASSPDGQSHEVPIHWVARIDDRVHLLKTLPEIKAAATRSGASETDAVADQTNAGLSGHPGASETDAVP